MGRRHIWTVLLAVWVTISGCNSLFLYDMKNGQNALSSAYHHLEAAEDLDMTVTLNTVKIRIIGDQDKFRGRYGLSESVSGYVRINKDHTAEICILGYRANGKIVVNQLVLGHELTHILNHKNRAIAEPDKIEELFH